MLRLTISYGIISAISGASTNDLSDLNHNHLQTRELQEINNDDEYFPVKQRELREHLVSDAEEEIKLPNVRDLLEIHLNSDEQVDFIVNGKKVASNPAPVASNPAPVASNPAPVKANNSAPVKATAAPVKANNSAPVMATATPDSQDNSSGSESPAMATATPIVPSTSSATSTGTTSTTKKPVTVSTDPNALPPSPELTAVKPPEYNLIKEEEEPKEPEGWHFSFWNLLGVFPKQNQEDDRGWWDRSNRRFAWRVEDGKRMRCVFPFTWYGRQYDDCLDTGKDADAWCILDEIVAKNLDLQREALKPESFGICEQKTYKTMIANFFHIDELFEQYHHVKQANSMTDEKEVQIYRAAPRMANVKSTGKKKQCIIPFIWYGVTYLDCMALHDRSMGGVGGSWCPTDSSLIGENLNRDKLSDEMWGICIWNKSKDDMDPKTGLNTFKPENVIGFSETQRSAKVERVSRMATTKGGVRALCILPFTWYGMMFFDCLSLGKQHDSWCPIMKEFENQDLKRDMIGEEQWGYCDAPNADPGLPTFNPANVINLFETNRSEKLVAKDEKPTQTNRSEKLVAKDEKPTQTNRSEKLVAKDEKPTRMATTKSGVRALCILPFKWYGVTYFDCLGFFYQHDTWCPIMKEFENKNLIREMIGENQWGFCDSVGGLGEECGGLFEGGQNKQCGRGLICHDDSNPNEVMRCVKISENLPGVRLINLTNTVKLFEQGDDALVDGRPLIEKRAFIKRIAYVEPMKTRSFCVIPFMWYGRTFYDCLGSSSGKEWCPTDPSLAKYDIHRDSLAPEQWGLCEPRNTKMDIREQMKDTTQLYDLITVQKSKSGHTVYTHHENDEYEEHREHSFSGEIVFQIICTLLVFMPSLYVWNKEVFQKKPRIGNTGGMHHGHDSPTSGSNRLNYGHRSSSPSPRSPTTSISFHGRVGSVTQNRVRRTSYLGEGDFQAPLFGCLNDTDICVHGLFCPILRLVDSYVTSGIYSRQNAPMLSMAIFMTFVIFPFPLMCWLPSQRHTVRIALGGDDAPCDPKDCVVSNCCFFFHICQMAQDVDYAADARTTSDCKIERRIDRVVGGPIGVDDRFLNPIRGGSQILSIHNESNDDEKEVEAE